MNYIHRLKREEAIAKAELCDLYSSLDHKRVALCSAKYTGTDQDGKRKDWISTADVIRWIEDLRMSSQIAADDAAREFDRIQAAKPTLNRMQNV